MKCKNCKKKETIKYSKYSNGEFCCRECARAFSTKNKRKEISEKVSKKMTGRVVSDSVVEKIKGEKNGSYKNGKYANLIIEKNIKRLNGKAVKICIECEKEFFIEWKLRKQNFCSVECVKKNEGVKSKLSASLVIACATEEVRNRLREIGRKGGFGKKGYTKEGVYYQSNLEKQCFEFLEEKNIIFEPHKYIPNSSKISDLYLPSINCWIEIDGIDREKRKKWLGKDYDYWLEKIEIYKRENLNLIIVKKIEEFKKIIINKAL